MYTVLPQNAKKEMLMIYPITLGLNHDQKYTSREVGTDFNHILYVSEGEGIFVFNGTKITLSAGNAVFFKKRIPIDYGPKSGVFRTSWITFNGYGGEQLIKYFDAADYEITSFPDIELKIGEIFLLVEGNASFELMSSKTYSLLVDFFMKLKERSALPTLEKAKYFMNQNYGKDLSVADVAKHLGISQSLLFKLFREREKTTPIEYLQEVRIKKACTLLVAEKLSVSEIGSLCGFSDSSYFCKVFKKWVGCPPASYRNKFIDR